MRGAMDKVKLYTSDRQKLNEFSMVYYNNLLTLGPVLLLMYFMGEFELLPHQEALNSSSFYVALSFSCVLGFLISFASLWFLSTTTPTIFSLVGSLNKVPLAFRTSINTIDIRSLHRYTWIFILYHIFIYTHVCWDDDP